MNAKEIVVGWYTTGTKFKSHDVEINEVIRKYCPNPVLVVIDVEHSVHTYIYYNLRSFCYLLCQFK